MPGFIFPHDEEQDQTAVAGGGEPSDRIWAGLLSGSIVMRFAAALGCLWRVAELRAIAQTRRGSALGVRERQVRVYFCEGGRSKRFPRHC